MDGVSIEQLMEKTGLSREVIQKTLDSLQKKGLIFSDEQIKENYLQ